MGTMNKLRENTGVVLWILVISFGVIWVLQDSGAFNTAGSIGPDIIEVDGESISYEDFNQALSAQMDAYQQRTGESMPPQRIEQERDVVFDALVENILREREMDRLGIKVTDEELLDLFLGDNPHPLIQSYFGDGQGNVDQALLQNFIDDPEATPQLVQIESYIRAERRRQKLESLIGSTVRVTNEEIVEEFSKRNKSVNAEFVVLRYAGLRNDSVSVTEQDLRAYYNRNREDYARNRSYSVKYASIPKMPSGQDSTNSLASVAQLKSAFESAVDDSVFLAQYGSEQPYGNTFFARGELEIAIEEAVFANPVPGTVAGPVIAGNMIHLIKIQELRNSDTESVHARHILVRPQTDTEAGKAEALEKANALFQRLQNGEDFAELAEAESEDPGSAVRGGDVGWFGEGRMVPPFEEAAFGAPLNTPVGPVETQFGYHIIEVIARGTEEVKIADYAERLRPSSETLTRAQDRLEDLQYFTNEGGNFEEEAERVGLTVSTVEVEDGQTAIPGIGFSRSLMSFLQGASSGEASEVLELNNQFIVAVVENITEEGYRPFEDVESEIEALVYVEKKKEVLTRRMEAAYAQHGFDGLASALAVPLRTAENLKFNDFDASGIGRDQVFGGTVLGLAEGADSGVIAGENGVFVARVTSIDEPATMSDSQTNQLRTELESRRKTQVQREWLATLREEADVRDYRHNFYQ